MNKLKNLGVRIWILIFCLIICILAIAPKPWATGVEIKSVIPGTIYSEQNLAEGEKILAINGVDISTLEEYAEAVKYLDKSAVKLNIKTDLKEYTYESVQDIGFVSENLTVTSSKFVDKNAIIISINNQEVKTQEDLDKIEKELFSKEKLVIKTNKKEVALLARGLPQITVTKAKTSNLIKGLDLQGGTRALLRPVGEDIQQKDIEDLISVLTNRLNVYGLTDMTIRQASDLNGQKYVLVEIADVTSDEISNLIKQQGKFEAKIGDQIIFEGGKEDIPFVCRDDGSCAGIRNCEEAEDGYYCTFEFSIRLSQDAAKKQAEVTKNLNVILENGKEYLDKNLDFYLDGRLVDSLRISEGLKGVATQDIAISGPGYGATEADAFGAATYNMNNLQTILITGSLPYEIKVEKLDSISPILGKDFVRNAILVGILAFIGVSLVIYWRYRSYKILIPVMIILFSEVLMTLGVAAMIKWNLDIVSIAGIIAAVGTGVDDQIVMIDEIMKGDKEERYYSWKEKIKRSFFIITAAYATTVAAMIPLIWAGAGLVKGFAVTTIIGVSIGVFITRPAFAVIAEKILKK
ncbi:MAG: PDZ domain-containing protein [Candidatus Nanoarchaeia archaeon]|nr:PDZ domain-containing protein [Candidatus Nanoarchaeia archaeon]